METHKYLGVFCAGREVVRLSAPRAVPIAVMEMLCAVVEKGMLQSNVLAPGHYIAWDYLEREKRDARLQV